MEEDVALYRRNSQDADAALKFEIGRRPRMELRFESISAPVVQFILEGPCNSNSTFHVGAKLCGLPHHPKLTY